MREISSMIRFVTNHELALPSGFQHVQNYAGLFPIMDICRIVFR